MKNYILWDRIKVSENRYIDINTDWAFDNVTTDSTFTETPYNVWLRFLWVVEYPADTTQEVIDTLVAEHSEFNCVFITEAEANTFLAEIWDITVSDYIFTDNRPQEII